MATPEETARAFVNKDYAYSEMTDDSWLEMPASEMIKAIAKAIAAEREACATLAETVSLRHIAHPATPDGGMDATKRAIAVAIRNRS